MPNTNVNIVIRSVQHFDGLEPERVEQKAEGCLEKTPSGWTLTYLEGEETGMGGTRTTLELAENRVTLTRAGEVSSQMIFEAGGIHTSDYQTPYGVLPLEVHTHSLGAEMSQKGGRVALCYHIRLGPQQSGRTELSLEVTSGGKREEEEI